MHSFHAKDKLIRGKCFQSPLAITCICLIYVQFEAASLCMIAGDYNHSAWLSLPCRQRLSEWRCQLMSVDVMVPLRRPHDENILYCLWLCMRFNCAIVSCSVYWHRWRHPIQHSWWTNAWPSDYSIPECLSLTVGLLHGKIEAIALRSVTWRLAANVRFGHLGLHRRVSVWQPTL